MTRFARDDAVPALLAAGCACMTGREAELLAGRIAAVADKPARSGGPSAPRWNRCCEEGHYTPEAAAQHGAELAAAMLVREVRSLAPETAGAIAIRKLEAAA